MFKDITLNKLLSISIVFVAISSIAGYIEAKINIPVGNTFFWWTIQALIIYLYYYAINFYFDFRNSLNFRVVKWYLLWNIFSIIRGFFIAENYWDWKMLTGNGMALLLPIVAFMASNENITLSMLRSYIKYALPLFAVFAFIINPTAYGFYLVPIYFFMFFFPVLNTKWKRITGILTILILVSSFGARSNVIKFAIPVLFLLIYYLRYYISTQILMIIRNLFIVLPFLLFILAYSGVFNIFKIEEYTSGAEYVQRDKNGEVIEDLKADTRTQLYVDVLYSANKYNYWLIGRSPARGNEMRTFSLKDNLAGRPERGMNEVAILNIFNWTGLVGIFLYFLVFYRASYLAIKFSNNIFSKMLGLFIAFRWFYSWVEDVNFFTLTTFFLWVIIGLCMSKTFRAMSNGEVTIWIKSVFEMKYMYIGGMIKKK